MSNQVYISLMCLCIFAYLGTYVIRLADPQNTIVTIELKNGLIGKIFYTIMERRL